jgi:predicted ATP-dependent Lon-type protease
LVLVAALAVAGYFIYDFYSENQLLKADVESKSQTISAQGRAIEFLNNNVTDLQGRVNNLSTELASKEAFIINLNEELSEAEETIVSLTPLTKEYYAVAVRSDGSGLVIPVSLKITGGTGSISVNIKNVDLLAGTQASLRTAAEVASDFSGVSINNKDITVTFVNTEFESITLDGPSAGSMLAVLIAAGLQNKTIDTTILLTGTIESSGDVGLVGSVSEKATIAKNFGAKKFLVPRGQAASVSGIDVIEVDDIGDVAALVLK